MQILVENIILKKYNGLLRNWYQLFAFSQWNDDNRQRVAEDKLNARVETARTHVSQKQSEIELQTEILRQRCGVSGVVSQDIESSTLEPDAKINEETPSDGSQNQTTPSSNAYQTAVSQFQKETRIRNEDTAMKKIQNFVPHVNFGSVALQTTARSRQLFSTNPNADQMHRFGSDVKSSHERFQEEKRIFAEDPMSSLQTQLLSSFQKEEILR